MAGTLFVLVRAAIGQPWVVVAGPTIAADAAAAATAELQRRPGARVVVTNGVRSFTSAITVTEDPAVVVDT